MHYIKMTDMFSSQLNSDVDLRERCSAEPLFGVTAMDNEEQK